MTALAWRAIGAVALFALFAAMGWRVTVWHEAYRKLPGVRAALALEEACKDGSKCAEREKAWTARAAQTTKEVSDGYEKEIADLRNRPPVTRVIRVCRATGAGDVRDAQPAAGADGTRPASGDVHEPDEFDTGPLRDLAREADEVSARLRALQHFNQALATTPPP